MRILKYLQYEPSTSPTVKHKPTHWSDIPTKRQVLPVKEGSAPIKNTASPHRSNGLYPAFSASGQDVWLPFASYKFPGLVLSAVGARCGKTFLANGEWSVVANTQVLKPKDIRSQKYWWYVMNLPDWWETGGAAQPYVLVSKTLSRKWPTPPIDEQIKIARYLDYKNYQINKYIRIKKRQIELLKELRQTIINDAVTGKIDVRTGNPYHKYKDSGIKWLGMIPEEWGMTRFKNVCYLQRGHDLSSDKFIKGEYPVMGSNGVIGYHNQYTTKAPNITIGRSGSTGKVNFVNENFWAHNTALFVLYNYGNDWDWLYYFIANFDMAAVSEGSAVPTLNCNYIHRIHVTVPPKERQAEIALYIKKATDNTMGIINIIKDEITLIKELQTRLISDVVTGKLDVRGIVVQDVPKDDITEDLNEAADQDMEETDAND